MVEMQVSGCEQFHKNKKSTPTMQKDSYNDQNRKKKFKIWRIKYYKTYFSKLRVLKNKYISYNNKNANYKNCTNENCIIFCKPN